MTGGILIYTTHRHCGTTRKTQFKLSAAAAGAWSGTVQLFSVLTVAGFKGGEGSAGIATVLILHTGLIHHDGVPWRIECLTV